MQENDVIWNQFVESGGFELASRKLETLVGESDPDTLYWAFQRTLTYMEPISTNILADAVAKRAASAIKRQHKEDLSLAKELSGGMCLGALA